MSKVVLTVLMTIAALMITGAIYLHEGGGGHIGRWFASLHGR